MGSGASSGACQAHEHVAVQRGTPAGAPLLACCLLHVNTFYVALQTVDIFSKDYLIIPIHDTLHWSLAIICHPGESTGGSKEMKSRGSLAWEIV